MTEIDESASPSVTDPEVAAIAAPVLGLCPRVPRAVMEEAKMGFTRGLESMMGSPPAGMLLNVRRPVCGQIGDCPGADARKCTTRNVRSPGRPFVGQFPICWELDTREKAEPNRYAAEARALAALIVSAWREGRRVVVVTP